MPKYKINKNLSKRIIAGAFALECVLLGGCQKKEVQDHANNMPDIVSPSDYYDYDTIPYEGYGNIPATEAKTPIISTDVVGKIKEKLENQGFTAHYLNRISENKLYLYFENIAEFKSVLDIIKEYETSFSKIYIDLDINTEDLEELPNLPMNYYYDFNLKSDFQNVNLQEYLKGKKVQYLRIKKGSLNAEDMAYYLSKEEIYCVIDSLDFDLNSLQEVNNDIKAVVTIYLNESVKDNQLVLPKIPYLVIYNDNNIEVKSINMDSHCVIVNESRGSMQNILLEGISPESVLIFTDQDIGYYEYLDTPLVRSCANVNYLKIFGNDMNIIGTREDSELKLSVEEQEIGYLTNDGFSKNYTRRRKG